MIIDRQTSAGIDIKLDSQPNDQLRKLITTTRAEEVIIDLETMPGRVACSCNSSTWEPEAGGPKGV